MTDGVIEDPMPDQATKKEPEDEPDDEAVKAHIARVKTGPDRRPRGWLEQDVRQVCDKYVTGEVKMEGDPPLTPHRVARLVKELDGLDEPPSVGAVAAVFNRWEEIGFCVMTANPRAFKDYTEAGQTRGLAALKAERTEAKRLEKERIKQAEAQG